MLVWTKKQVFESKKMPSTQKPFQAVSSFGELSKSKSSAAVLQDGATAKKMSKAGQLKLVATSWNKDKVNEERKISHQGSIPENIFDLVHEIKALIWNKI